jgi:sarcosine/dimethylglycine N-methyltransferase
MQSAVTTARDYYDSDDADRFYSAVWGGEDIHIGIYEGDDDDIAAASRRTIEKMASRIEGLGDSTALADLGSGYCGAARYLAAKYRCHVTAINISQVENDKAKELNAQAGLSDHIDVLLGSFETITRPPSSFDVVWSQDAILHAGDRRRVITEIARVLKKGGQLVFTDPMQSDGCDREVLAPILDRIHLESLGSPSFYREAAREAGLKEVGFDDLTDHLITHYSRVLEETEAREASLANEISKDYLERMRTGLRHWIAGGKAGHLVWGIFHFRKPG